jgi:predicted AlkP superfamily pyrophosphatase or phosphodiesterase
LGETTVRRLGALLLPLLFLAACRTASVSGHGRVVLLSLDGADSVTLHRLFEEGKLGAGGFARFFRDGQVAAGLQPVDPSITAVNHIALATGYSPAETGIVANDFIPPGGPLGRTVSGFATGIATETLWEAARRQGLRVAVSAWPGADGRDERRRGDWGMTYAAKPPLEARVVELPREEWTPGLPQRAGDWSLVPCRTDERPERPGCYVKALEIAPDLSRGRFLFDGEYALHGYPEDFEARLHELGLVWPGPPDGKLLTKSWWGGTDGIDLGTWMEQEERFSTFFTDALLATARFREWDLLMGYTAVLDDSGHQLLLTDPRQPGYSPERRDELDRARTRIWQAVDRDLARLLAAVDLRTTTFLVVSDHGMAPVHTVLEPTLLLREWGFLTPDARGKADPAASLADAVGQGGICNVYVRADLPERERFVEDLRSRFLAWRVEGEAPVARALTRAEAAEIGLNHPNSGDLILLARSGYQFRSPEDPANATPASPSRLVYGKHGYPNTDRAMQAIYMAVGRGVKPGPRGTVRNAEVAAEVAARLGIEPPRRLREP